MNKLNIPASVRLQTEKLNHVEVTSALQKSLDKSLELYNNERERADELEAYLLAILELINIEKE